MLLKMNKDGQVYQSDAHYSTDIGFGRAAPMVDGSNLMTLSETEDKKSVADRKHLKSLENASLYKKLRMQAERARKEKAVFGKIRAIEDSVYNARQKTHQATERSANTLLEQAIAQGHQFSEKMSGVSGFGLTDNGVVPNTQDYVKIHDVQDDFGMIDQLSGPIPSFAKPGLPAYSSPMAPGALIKAAVQPQEAADESMLPPEPLEPPPVVMPSESLTVIPDVAPVAQEKRVQASQFVHPMLRYGLIPSKG